MWSERFQKFASCLTALAVAAQVTLARAEQPPSGSSPASAPATPAEPPSATPPPNQSAAPAASEGFADADPSALSDFRPTLEGRGYWVEDRVYGMVWVPYPAVVGVDFAPYVTSGHWALTAGGDWIWVSDYPWGWVVFHYGRWVWVPSIGWAWIPGHRYAHAWVVWRVGESDWDYIGWAPMPPTFVWFGGVAVVVGFYPPEPFVFCRTRYVFDVRVHGHLVPRTQLHDVATHTHRWHSPAGNVRVGPTLVESRVPAAVVPRTRASPNPKAIAASRPALPRPRFVPQQRAPASSRATQPSAAPTPRTPQTTPPRTRSRVVRPGTPSAAAPPAVAAPSPRAAPRAGSNAPPAPFLTIPSQPSPRMATPQRRAQPSPRVATPPRPAQPSPRVAVPQRPARPVAPKARATPPASSRHR